MIKYYILIVFCLVLVGCSSEAADDITVPEEQVSSKITFRFLNGNNQAVEGNKTVILSTPRKDNNILVPISESVINKESYSYNIKQEKSLRLTVYKSGYNPVYKDVLLTNGEQVVDVVMEPRSGVLVLSYNVKDGLDYANASIHKKRVDEFVAWVKFHDPDVVLLQEMNAYTEATLNELASRYGHEHSALLKLTGYPTAITSKSELSDVRRTVLDPNRLVDPPYGLHGYLYAKTKGIHFYAVHLSSQSQVLREYEAAEIVKDAQRIASDSRIVIGGDLNSPCRNDEKLLGGNVWLNNLIKHKPTAIPLNFKATDSFLDNGFVETQTINNTYYRTTHPIRNYWTSDYFGSRLDYIFVNKVVESKVSYAEVLQTKYTQAASDHYPILMHIKD